jgi:tetratricopeptide (TPR) repeat protein
MRHVLKLREKTLGPEHPDTLRAREGVSNTLGSLGQFKDAIVQKRDLLALERKVLGAEDKLTVRTLENLGWMLADNGEFRDGEAMLREALRLCEKVFGAERTTTLECRTLLARTLAAQTKGLEAEAEAREIVKVNDKAFGPDRSGWTRDLVGVILDKQGRYPEAETQMREALRMLGKTPSDEDTETDTFKFRGHLAKTLWYQGKDAEAEIIIRELIARNEKVLGTHAYDLGRNMQGRLEEQTLELTPLTSRTLLANTLRDQGKYAEAEAEYKNVIPIEEKVLGPENFDTLNACYNYAYQLAQQGKRNEAKPLAERAAKTAAKVLPANDPDTREYEKFLEILEKGQPIPTPYMKFHEIFWLGKET